MDSMICGHPVERRGNLSIEMTCKEANALIGELEGLWPGPVIEELLDELRKWV